MIAKMKKYTFLVHTTNFKPFLDRLQDVGAVHLTQTVCNIEGEEKKIFNWLRLCTEAIERISQYQKEKNYVTHHIRDDRKATYILKEYQKYVQELNILEADIQQRDKDYFDCLPWGNFDPELLQKLHANAINLQFFYCDNVLFDPQWQALYDLEIIQQTKQAMYFVVVTNGNDKVMLAANEVTLPTISLERQLKELDDLKVRRATINKHFKELIPYLPTLEAEKLRLMNALTFDRAEQCTDSSCDDQLRILTGFVPEEKETALKAMLESDTTYYFEEAPSIEEDIPILLKNNRFTKLFEPITKIFALPSYAELDLTPFLAPFFMLFVGFCAGDAGYGLLLVVAGIFAKRKVSASFKPLVSLIQWLGVATILFGVLTGTFFGVELVKVKALSFVKNFFFNQDSMMVLALALGAVQIVCGMILNAVNVARQHGVLFAIGKIGWIVLLLSSVVTFGLPMLNIVLISTALYALYGLMGLSLIAIFFLNSPGKNPLIQFGLGLWDSYGMITGLLGDMLSYVRLFALGLTGGILGMVFNSLAVEMSPDIPVVGTLFTLFILIFGHSLNFALTMLGAFVHPVRLTFVEFYKNAGFNGGGRAYEPFKKLR
ncbi:V-type ATP synthase subunit I [Bacteroidia bacterium]|nr:V-type ATP synthase subunit I [Bacteroidia bacterium]